VQRAIMILAIMTSGFCGMIAEYSVSTMVGYLVGNTIAAFTIIISVFMLSMGAGGFASEKVGKGELEAFLGIELVLSVFAASSTAFIAQAAVLGLEWEAAFFCSASLGFMIGFEIPLLMRVNERYGVILRKNVSRVFAADYFGSFIAGLTFSWFLLPRFGVVNTPIMSGGINLVIAIVMLLVFRGACNARRIGVAAAVATAIVVMFAFTGEQFVFHTEQAQYEDRIVLAHQTPYQRIIVTESPTDRLGGKTHCLYLNGHTQFCTQDEERYHEMLVHPAFALQPNAKRVLVLGGGDGIALREILRYDSVESAALVDLDPQMVERCSGRMAESDGVGRMLSEVNAHSFDDPRVTTVAADAFVWLGKSDKRWDAIIVDFPDPSNPEVAKLYSREFYRRLYDHLEPQGVAVVQSTSPIHSPKPFRIINYTMEDAGLAVVPYRVNVPSFGDWGFHVAVRKTWLRPEWMKETLDAFDPKVYTRFLNRDAMQAATRWEKGMWDTGEDRVISRLARPVVQIAYNKSWEIE